MSAQPVDQPRRTVATVGAPMPSPGWNLGDLGRPLVTLVVAGVPAPQGSKAFKGMRAGKPVLAESSKKVGPWRAAVAAAWRQVKPRGWEPLDGPLVADMVFSMPRPKSAPKTLRTLPATYPDLSKLARSTEDALGTDENVVADDSRIVAYRRLEKVYERDQLDPDALRHPGAVIRLWQVPADLLGRIG